MNPTEVTSTASPQNVNQAEIDKFSEQASHWWDPNGALKSLHEINPLRLQWIKSCLEQSAEQTHPESHTDSILKGLRCIDVGCGGGLLSEAMAAEGADVTGIDLAQKSLTVARLHSLETGVPVKYQNISAEDMALQHPGHYDVVTCMEMLEHVPDPASVVRACATMVKPGGWVFFSTLNRNPKSFLFAIVGAEYLLNIVPRGTHQWESFIKPSELASAVRDSGLELKQMTGLTYNPMTKVYRLESDTSVNYMIGTRRPN